MAKEDRVGAIKMYFVVEQDGRQFLSSTKRGLEVIRKIEATNVHQARMIYWRQLKQLA